MIKGTPHQHSGTQWSTGILASVALAARGFQSFWEEILRHLLTAQGRDSYSMLQEQE